MPRYLYSAKSQPQKTVKGEIEAESEQEALIKITNLGFFPLSLEVSNLSKNKGDILRLFKISSRDITLLTGQLASLLQSGVNIVNSLTIVANQANNKMMREMLLDIVSRVKGGKSLSESFSAYPKLFSGLFIAMIHSGEASGNIESSLSQLADYMEKESDFRNTVQSALIYPFFLLTISALTVIVLLGFVIPRLVTMFEDMGQMLPLPTKILITISSFLRDNWLMLGAGFTVIGFLTYRTYLSPQGRIYYDTMKLKLPLIGMLTIKTEVGRLSKTLSLLLSSGLAIISSLEISLSVLENQVLRAEVSSFKDKLAKGESLSSCLKSSRFFPEFVTNIVQTGEEAGTVEKSLGRIADTYEKEVDRTLKTLTRLLEPVIILAMGLIVGFIVISMLLPIFQINLIVQ